MPISLLSVSKGYCSLSFLRVYLGLDGYRSAGFGLSIRVLRSNPKIREVRETVNVKCLAP